MNWDVAEHRERILQRELPPVKFLVFDEESFPSDAIRLGVNLAGDDLHILTR